MKSKPIKLLHVTTVPKSLNFLASQINYMVERSLDVHGLASPGKDQEDFIWDAPITMHAVEMPRRITPLKDLQALCHIFREMRNIQPHIVHSHTPKGGLLGMIGAWLARVPVRIYHIHGLPMVTATGLKRTLLRCSEKVSCKLAVEVWCVSNSVRKVAIAEGLCPASKIKVLLNGSISGVDAKERFNPARFSSDDRNKIRAEYNIPADAIVLGYIGRIVNDKGFSELIESWQTLREEYPSLYLLAVGPFEPQDPVAPDVERVMRSDERIRIPGINWETPPLYKAMDIVVLPSYREGFPVVPMEASSMGLPVVATQIPGCVDAIQDGVTGTLVPPRDAKALTDAIRRYVKDPSVRNSHGQAGRDRMMREFCQDMMCDAVYSEYLRLLEVSGIA